MVAHQLNLTNQGLGHCILKMKYLGRVAFVLSLVAAASATGDASPKKSTLTYTATTTKTITPSTTLTGDFTGITYSTTYTGSTVSGYATSVTGTNTYTYTQTHTSYTRPKAAKTVSVPVCHQYQTRGTPTLTCSLRRLQRDSRLSCQRAYTPTRLASSA